MNETTQPAGETAVKKPKKGKKKLLLLLAIVPVVLGGVAAAYFFVPAVSHMVDPLIGRHPAGADVAAVEVKPIVPRPQFIELPEMAVTLANGGRPRQMRIKLALELTRATPTSPDVPATDVLSPRVLDALLAYLRTLRDGDTEGGLALDRIRGDLYRRLTLILGPDIIQDVLVTSLVMA